jgi:hypothetical protein
MPRRPGDRLSVAPRPIVVGLAAGLVALGVACQSGNPGTAGCQFSQDVAVPGSPLTLLSDAQLERVGASYALTGADADHATARWALFDPTAGALGPEQSLALPPAGAGPWLTVSSEQTSGDTALVALAIAAANGADAELHVVAVPTSSPPVAAPPLGPALAVVKNGFANGAAPTVALGASRSGPHAVLAWIDPSDPMGAAVTTLVLSAAGEPIGTPAVLESLPKAACLGFAPGKGALTLVYEKFGDAKASLANFMITELRDAGDVDSTLELILDHAASCPRLTPTDVGYALAFQDSEGSWLGVYDAGTNGFAINPFAAAVSFGGPSLQPPLAGLAPAGADFAVLLDRAHGGELWRVTSTGGRRAGQLLLPSASGMIGAISAVPDSQSITATYADYATGGAAGTGPVGQRYFVTMACQ